MKITCAHCGCPAEHTGQIILGSPAKFIYLCDNKHVTLSSIEPNKPMAKEKEREFWELIKHNQIIEGWCNGMGFDEIERFISDDLSKLLNAAIQVQANHRPK